jgi:hypothetical protein
LLATEFSVDHAIISWFRLTAQDQNKAGSKFDPR